MSFWNTFNQTANASMNRKTAQENIVAQQQRTASLAQETSQAATEFKQQQQSLELIRKDANQRDTVARNAQWITGEAEANDIKNFMVNKPDVAQAMNIQNPNTISEINVTDAMVANSPLQRYLMNTVNLDPTIYERADGTQDTEAFNKTMLEVATTMKPIIKSIDGDFTNLHSVYMALPSTTHLLGENQKRVEEVVAGIRTKLGNTIPKTSDIDTLHKMASAEFDINDFDTPAAYQKAVNNRTRELRFKETTYSDRPTSAIQNYEYYTKLSQNGTPDEKKFASGFLQGMSMTGTQRNVQDEMGRSINTSTTQPQATQVTTPQGATITKLEAPKPRLNKAQLEAQFEQTPKYNSKVRDREDAYLTSAKTVKSINETYKQLEKAIRSGKFKSGFLDSMAQWAQERDPTGKLGSGIEQLLAGASLQTVTADVLKAYSGASATEQEFVRTMLRVVGDDNMQEEQKLALFKQFADKATRGFEEEGLLLEGMHRYSTVEQGRQAMQATLPEQPKTSNHTGIDLDAKWGL